MWLWRYEELKQDQEGMLRKIADFTGFVLTEEEIQVAVHFSGHLDDWTSSLDNDNLKRLNEHMKFDNYQKSSSLNVKAPNWWEIWKIQLFTKYVVLELCKRQGNGQFIRKGIVGDWMNHFTPELNKVILNFITYCHNCMYTWIHRRCLKEILFMIFFPTTGVQQLD